MFIEFVIQYSPEEFAQILDIPCEGACVFTDKWSFDELAYGVPTDGPYQTNPPSPDDIILYIRIDREERIMAREEVVTSFLLPPPSTNHPSLILTMMMMMEMAKEPCVQALLLPFALLTP
uniref:Pentatricopeptide repeat-containing protein n=1 Tax=Tanacetum cinerariifolium TaxID=118510 RepID=A0A6L2JPZ9_TANCI|nr:pentatricopeptide repeat-containing protein [Tanacetum cinerariifolium]